MRETAVKFRSRLVRAARIASRFTHQATTHTAVVSARVASGFAHETTTHTTAAAATTTTRGGDSLPYGISNTAREGYNQIRCGRHSTLGSSFLEGNVILGRLSWPALVRLVLVRFFMFRNALCSTYSQISIGPTTENKFIFLDTSKIS
jgi:hypothetical protein